VPAASLLANPTEKPAPAFVIHARGDAPAPVGRRGIASNLPNQRAVAKCVRYAPTARTPSRLMRFCSSTKMKTGRYVSISASLYCA
jgi:hypothetical protein